MSTELVKSIMSRLIALQLASDPTTYLVQIEQEDDTDDDVPDPTYVRGSDYEARTGSRFSPLLWRDLFEINIALHQASTLDNDHAITSAIARIEEAVGDWTKVLGVVEPPFLQALHEAIADKEQLKIVYAAESESQFTTRSIEPTEIRMLNGRFFVRAWCHLRADWRNFRVDRIVDVVAKSPRINQPPEDTSLNWLSEAGDGGFDVVVVLPPAQRWVFETLTNVQWAVVSDELLAAKVAIRSEDFLDRLMLKAGPGCSVVTHEYAAAGRALARTIEKLL
jgi:proteasome accessory factor C